MAQARGMRNNNPLNIRKGENWQGLRETQTDSAFCQFVSMEYGLRAAFVTIRTYMNKYALGNVASIVRRWAPPSENNTDKYVEAVCKDAQIAPFHALKFSNKEQMVDVVAAMVKVECGCTIEKETITKAYEMV